MHEWIIVQGFTKIQDWAPTALWCLYHYLSTQVHIFPILKCEDLLLPFLCYCKLNIFGIWTVGQTKPTVQRCDLALWKICNGHISKYISIYIFSFNKCMAWVWIRHHCKECNGSLVGPHAVQFCRITDL